MNEIESKRVLIVESDRTTLHSHSTRLSQQGFRVEEASKASDAVRRAKTDEFDFLISEAKMPGMSGLDLLRHVRRHSQNVQTLLLLDEPDNDVVVKGTELGGVQCLVKPVQPDLLVKATLCLAKTVPKPASSENTVVRVAPGLVPTLRLSNTTSFSASEAKNKFSQVLEKAIQGNVVFITKHENKKAVLLSVDSFDELSRIPQSRIDQLGAEFDDLLARMQGPAARKAMETAFHASPEQLGQAAVRAARKRV
jgi:antitoxin Phd